MNRITDEYQTHRVDAMMLGGFLIVAAVGLYGLQKLGFRAVIGVGRS